jgi:hypothetical protein
VPRALALAAALLLIYGTLEHGRGYWLRIHGAEDDPGALPLAAQIRAHTDDDDLIATVGLEWSPAVLYYADRWGHMVTTRTASVAYDLLRRDGYRYLVSPELDTPSVRELDRWSHIGALDRNLYVLADDAGELDVPAFATNEGPGVPLAQGAVEVPCDRPHALAVRSPGTWLRFAAAVPDARIQASDELAPLPVRRFVWVSSELASQGGVQLFCTGTSSVTIEAMGAGPAS